jgi:hypothetical protein
MRIMQRIPLAAFIGLMLATPTVTSAQAPDIRQALGSLLTGNQERDNAVQQAYERGYQRGRNDEARQRTYREPGNRNGYNQDRRDYYDR